MHKYTAHEQFGYIGRDTVVITDFPLERKPYAQAGVNVRIIFDEKGEPHTLTTLYSYTTEVIRMYDKRFVLCTGTYSQTTRKHIGAFVSEYIGMPWTYKTMKDLAENGLILDLQTGELWNEDDVHSYLNLNPNYLL